MSNNKIILISLTQSEIQDLISDVVKQELEKIHFNNSLPETSELITKKEAAKLLRISLPTLSELIFKGSLNAYRIGSNVRLKKQEVLNSLTKIQTI